MAIQSRCQTAPSELPICPIVGGGSHAILGDNIAVATQSHLLEQIQIQKTHGYIPACYKRRTYMFGISERQGAVR